MKKQKRGIRIEPDYKSMKLVGFGILAVICLLFAKVLTGCTTPSDDGGVISVIQSLPIAQARIYYDLYAEAETLEEKREVLVMLRTDVEGGPYAIIIPRIAEEIARIDRQIEIRDMPTPTPAPTAKPEPDDDDGCNPVPFPDRPHSFLWKPVSERGTLVILLDADYSGHVSSVTVAGEKGKEHGLGNGCREHWRYSRSGAGYGQNIPIVMTLKDGSVWGATIPNGAERYDRKIKFQRR